MQNCIMHSLSVQAHNRKMEYKHILEKCERSAIGTSFVPINEGEKYDDKSTCI